MAAAKKIPSSIIIVGSGVFGLSTAWALIHHDDYRDTKITIVEQQPFPPPDGSSIDSSRIVRADYADIAYARFALEAQDKWRNSWWGEGVYHEDGLAIAIRNPSSTAQASGANLTGKEYMRQSLENVQRLGLKQGRDVTVLPSGKDVSDLFSQPDGSSRQQADFDCDMGYINHRSGWVDATGSMTALRARLVASGRVDFLHATVSRLLFSRSPSPTPPSSSDHIVRGVSFADNNTSLTADLTILSTGAWTSTLVDLRGIASATGQIVAYLPLTPSEQRHLSGNPTILNESTGLFIITPSGDQLKVARHGYGYTNPTTIPDPSPPSSPDSSPDSSSSSSSSSSNNNNNTTTTNKTIRVSLPTSSPTLPTEAHASLRAFLARTFPSLADRPFTRTRVCWYLDTPASDWLIDAHPQFGGTLFLACAGSGHAFKFAPVLGDVVVRRLRREDDVGFGFGRGHRWDWPAEEERRWDEGGTVWSVDWRGGRRGMVLEEELARAGKGKL